MKLFSILNIYNKYLKNNPTQLITIISNQNYFRLIKNIMILI